MRRLRIPEPFSGGVFLSYKCGSRCRHCMYACSPDWRGDWVDLEDLREVLSQLASKINKRYPTGSDKLGVNYGLHFTGGEPFLNFELLLEAVEIASDLKIPSTFVETNCFWCVDEEVTCEKLVQLKKAGLSGLLISVNPFILEYVPYDRTIRAVKVGRKIFGENTMIYQNFFYDQFKRFNLKTTLPLEEYLQKSGLQSLSYAELIPMGRAPYTLGNLFKRYPVKKFFGESCEEELTRDWHVHVDNYSNYMTGYCGGISLGDARNLSSICEKGVDLETHPVIKTLISDIEELYELAVERFGYKERPEGYISKCHLCIDMRKYLTQKTSEFEELQPTELYRHLE